MTLEKPSLKGKSHIFKKKSSELTSEELAFKREYNRISRAVLRQDPDVRRRDKEAYHRCINKDRKKVLARNAAWRKKNWAQVKEQRKRPSYKIPAALRSRIANVLKRQKAIKNGRLLEILGCDADFLRAYLAARFFPGMTWENHGKWHIDHIRPCASFDLTDPKQQEQCFHYTNLQPLWAVDNLKKSNKLLTPVVQC